MHLHGALPSPPRLAIVGSRAARRASLEAVRVLVETARDHGCAVVSGGAVGVDAAAHRAALELGVRQVAVLPLGEDRPYPPQHGPLFAAIAAAPGSGVVHAQAPGTRPTRGMFASRNRTVVELADGVVVVQAGLRSGTLGTGRLALRIGRPLGVLFGSPGAAQLAAEGARWIDREGPGGLQAAASRWLEGVLDPSRHGGGGDVATVPPHLRDVVHRARTAGTVGITADDCDAPMLALGLLAEAEALGLLVGVGGGRYVPGTG